MSTVNKVEKVNVGGLEGQGLKPVQLINPADVISEKKPVEQLGVYDSPKNVDLEIGVWTCSPCVEQVESFEISEFCVVAAGQIRLTDNEGNSELFESGDSFVIYKGFSGRYEIVEDLVKYYAMF